MSDDFGTPITPLEEPKKKNNTMLIIAIVVIVLLCCCCAAGGAIWYLYQNGDQIFGLTLQQAYLLL
jgi:hypothetical protein